MCGRFARYQKPSVYAELFGVESLPAGPSYNVAPSQDVAAVRTNGHDRECVLLRWGPVPSWSKDGKSIAINARAETAAGKPAFRSAFRKRRCLVLADGYYEWKAEGKVKRPFFFHRRDGQPFAFAGLWECWHVPDGPAETCAILTTDANELTRVVHDRMPVILTPETGAVWIDPDVSDPEALQGLLRPFPAEETAFHEVSRLVNNPRNNRPELILPVAG
jgi:putative SOS response-associated peptidase YedK